MHVDSMGTVAGRRSRRGQRDHPHRALRLALVSQGWRRETVGYALPALAVAAVAMGTVVAVGAYLSGILTLGAQLEPEGERPW